MGTRSVTRFFDGEDKQICALYAQYDGYPSGHGAALAKFLNGLLIVNGLRGGDEKTANGMNCLAAMIIAHLKEGAGTYYLYGPDAEDQEFVYEIRPPRGDKRDPVANQPLGEPVLAVRSRTFDKGTWKPVPLFSGTAQEFCVWLAKGEPEIDHADFASKPGS